MYAALYLSVGGGVWALAEMLKTSTVANAIASSEKLLCVIPTAVPHKSYVFAFNAIILEFPS